jgi:hypothetical protein
MNSNSNSGSVYFYGNPAHSIVRTEANLNRRTNVTSFKLNFGSKILSLPLDLCFMDSYSTMGAHLRFVASAEVIYFDCLWSVLKENQWKI